jgi:4-hydroxy-tetrahydrodipicolinate reductase
MNLGIIGYGKMGRMIEAAAKSRGHIITAVIDPYIEPYIDDAASAGSVLFRSLTEAGEESAVKAADVFVEFTRPDTAPGNIGAAASLGKPVVSGSTGWYEKLEEVSAAVKQAGSSLLWSSNFSLGVNLFFRIASYAAKLADPFPEYDAGGYEIHHNKKADSPSGTAKILVDRVLASMSRKTLNYASLRVGSVPGVHSLIFDSPADTIEITHTARNREGFASGAIIAAEWLVSCPGPGKSAGPAKRGIFTMDDVLKDILP